MLYFAYGSNLHAERLRRRVPSRLRVAVGRLDGYGLAFDKRGRDGSGKCTLTPGGAGVWGLVYRMDPAEQGRLDAAEGLGAGYERCRLEVTTLDGTRTVQSYIAPRHHRAGELAAFDWYLDLVLAGARAAPLPPDYCARLACTPTRPDPDRARVEAHRALLGVTASGSPAPRY
jgi:gamma-glutamylcyclotransferase (GGCT)/AIG2-like uncharacterized protein YtfP